MEVRPDADTLDEVWKLYADEIFRCCRSWLAGRPQTDIDDAFGRVWLRVVTKLPAAGVLSDTRAWLMRVTYRICMDLHRERKRSLEDDVETDTLGSRLFELDPERMALRKELRRFLADAVERLPDRLRETMIGYLRSSNYSELAHRLAISEPNARKRIQEARAILRASLSEYRAGRGIVRRPRGNKRASRPTPGMRAMRPLTRTTFSGVMRQSVVSFGEAPRTLSAAALGALERHVSRYPTGAIRRLLLAHALVARGEVDAAIGHYETLLSARPRRSDVWSELASLLDATGRVDGLFGLRERAAAAGLPREELAYLAGIALTARGQSAEAERMLLQAHELAPKSARPLVALARAATEAGRWPAAIEACDAALALDPNDVAALTSVEHPMRMAGRTAEVRRRMQRALNLDPENPIAAARCFEDGIRAGRALPEAQTVIVVRLAAARADAARALAVRAVAAGRPMDGILELSNLRRTRPELAEAVVERARLLDHLGASHHALGTLAALRHESGWRELQLLLLGIAVRAALPDEVLSIAIPLAERDRSWPAMSMAAWALAATGHRSHGREFAEMALASATSLPAAWLQHAATMRLIGERETAIASYEVAWTRFPSGDGFELAAACGLDAASLHEEAGRGADASLWRQPRSMPRTRWRQSIRLSRGSFVARPAGRRPYRTLRPRSWP